MKGNTKTNKKDKKRQTEIFKVTESKNHHFTIPIYIGKPFKNRRSSPTRFYPPSLIAVLIEVSLTPVSLCRRCTGYEHGTVDKIHNVLPYRKFMALKDILKKLCDEFLEHRNSDVIWAAIPEIIPELRLEFEKRLGIVPEIGGISLVLAEVEPQLACGTNSIVFNTYFPVHKGLRISCECCLEHPNAKVSVRKVPDVEIGSASDAIRIINENCIGNTFEANLLRIEGSIK